MHSTIDGGKNFEVLSTKNTVRHYPGDFLDQRELERLVHDKAITINIKEAKA